MSAENLDVLMQVMKEHSVPKIVQKALIDSIKDGVFQLQVVNVKVRLKMRHNSYEFKGNHIALIGE